MKKAIYILLLIFIAISSSKADVSQKSKVITIETEHTSLIYSINYNERLEFRYYGNHIKNTGNFNVPLSFTDPDTNRDLDYEAYPSYGYVCKIEPALSVIHSNGALVTELIFVREYDVLNNADIQHKVIILKDKVYNLIIELHTEAYRKEDVITQWVVIKNNEEGAIQMNNFYSSFLNLNASSYYLTHFSGSWADEMNRIVEKIDYGIKNIGSKKGVRTTQTENPSFIVSINQPVEENEGECYGGALAWSGNYNLSFEMDERNHLSILSGINPFMSAYKLNQGESFITPQMVYSYSNQGLGKLSRNFHDWARKYSLVDGLIPRPILLNSWEGAYFSFTEETLTKMMDEAADIGIEMFVLDDGWFGNKYPRNADNAGLGDWQTNQKKLPRGLDFLISHAQSKGLKFGIWIEPEMVNPKSELAEKHAEWIVQSPGREKITIRNQLLLDLTNREVQNFIWETIDSLLMTHPQISYIKWDANRHVEQVGSTFLDERKQTHFWVDYTRGLYSIYTKIRDKYPKLIMQVCASGGGRVDFGSMKFHQEFWASDNTDPLERLFIQYSTNIIYPPVATAAHVSTSPNHQTGRVTPLKFRFDVAMTGRLGMELQPEDIKDKDRNFAKSAIINYKEFIRPLITKGDLFRIYSPYDVNGWSSQMYVAKDKTHAVLFAFSTSVHARNVFPTLKLKGLDVSKNYRIIEINQLSVPCFRGNDMVFSGEFLANVGIEIKISRQFDSAVFQIKEE